MGALTGLPDFGAPVAAPGPTLFLPFESGAAALVPDGLQVATRADGTPAFRLSIVRRAPHDPLPPYAALTLELGRVARPDVALAALRAVAPAGTLAPVMIDDGWAALQPAAPSVILPDDMTRPTRLERGLGSASWTAQLALSSGELLKGALASQTLLLAARVALVIRGVAPRLPVRVRFNPAAWVATLGTAAPASAGASAARSIAYDDLVQLLARATAPGLTITPALEAAQIDRFAQAMAGRLAASYGTLQPAPLGSDGALVQLDATRDNGQVTWDLDEPVPVPRPWLFTLDPLDAARRLLAQAGTASALVREVTTEPLQLGFWSVDVAANLPSARQGLYDLGVLFEAPPRPPLRPQALVVSQSLHEPDDAGRVALRLAPAEKLAYTYKGFAILQQNDGARQLTGNAQPGTSGFLSLGSADFPLRFVVVDADAAILALATFRGTLQYQDGATAVTSSFLLSSAAPRAALALPLDAAAASLALDVLPLAANAAPLHLGPLPASSQHFSLASFAQYGPQEVSVSARFGAGAGPLVVDLLAEGQPETADHVASVLLTPAAPLARFGYVAASPFASGYRWRLHDGGAWSPVLAPGAPLLLDADALVPHSAPVVEELDGLHLYASRDDAGVVYYIPGEPTPETTDAGKPTLLLIASDAGGILQLGVRWAASEAELALASADFSARHPELEVQRLAPAPLTVQSVVVSVGDGAGGWTALGSSASSGFPPYNTVFNLRLDAAQRTQAVAAIEGRAGCLRVELQVALPPAVAATLEGAPATLVRISDISRWFPDNSGKDHLMLTGAALSG